MKTIDPAYCQACDGSGETTVLSGGGPDAYDVQCDCFSCGGTGAAPKDEAERLQRALVYVAHALHGTRQHMLAPGITLIDNDTVCVAIDGWEVSASINPHRQSKPELTWPKAREVSRIGDMHPNAHIRIGFDSDNDVYIDVWDGEQSAALEFCNGGGGGGRSSRTRLALIALMVAIEADNAETPHKDWHALRAATPLNTAKI